MKVPPIVYTKIIKGLLIMLRLIKKKKIIIIGLLINKTKVIILQ